MTDAAAMPRAGEARSQRIAGDTRVYAIIGDPIAQVASPLIFNSLFAERCIDAVLVPLQVPPPGLASLFDMFRTTANLNGLVVTVPHKVDALRLVDQVQPAALRIGAINAIRKEPDGRLTGGNFDGIGFVAGLVAAGHGVAGREALVVGSGGAGRAIAHALADAGVVRIGVHDADRTRADTLAGEIAAAHPALTVVRTEPRARTFDLIVNCTPCGMGPGDSLPVDLAGISRGAIVADIVLKPSTTALLREADRLGCFTQPGLPMLQMQSDAVLAFFMGDGSHGA